MRCSGLRRRSSVIQGNKTQAEDPVCPLAKSKKRSEQCGRADLRLRKQRCCSLDTMNWIGRGKGCFMIPDKRAQQSAAPLICRRTWPSPLANRQRSGRSNNGNYGISHKRSSAKIDQSLGQAISGYSASRTLAGMQLHWLMAAMSGSGKTKRNRPTGPQ